MQITINFQNDTVAQKVLWMLERFKNDGVEIIKIDDTLVTIYSKTEQSSILTEKLK